MGHIWYTNGWDLYIWVSGSTELDVEETTSKNRNIQSSNIPFRTFGSNEPDGKGSGRKVFFKELSLK